MHYINMLCIAMLMEMVPSDKERGLKTPVWDEYKKILEQVK